MTLIARILPSALLLAGLALPPAGAQTPPPAVVQPAAGPPAAPAAKAPDIGPQLDTGLHFGLEPKAMAILKATSDKLEAAKTLSFTAVATYESPARTGLPLAYSTISYVLLRRPNMLRVVTPGDGPPSDFYYDGTQVMAYSPKANLVAVASAPHTIDEMLKAAYDVAAIYFPFTDVIVADPYKDLSQGLKVAFVMGQSDVVGGITTDMIVLANDTLQAQLWIGAQDHLPRRIRAAYFDEPGTFRHQVDFTNWVLNGAAPPGAFTSTRAAQAPHMQFGAPADKLPQNSPAQGSQEGQGGKP
jgi:hypothetical protein